MQKMCQIKQIYAYRRYQLFQVLIEKSTVLGDVIADTNLTLETLSIKMTGDQHFMICNY